MFFSQLTPHTVASLQGTTIQQLNPAKDSSGLAIANICFSEGVHYWEIVCPYNTDGVKVRRSPNCRLAYPNRTPIRIQDDNPESCGCTSQFQRAITVILLEWQSEYKQRHTKGQSSLMSMVQ